MNQLFQVTARTKMIELCKHYMTTGFPDYRPMCPFGRKASLKCHKKNPDCPQYEPSLEGHYPWKRDYTIKVISANYPTLPNRD